MIKLIKKFFLFVMIIFVCLAGIVSFHYWIIGSQYNYNYQASLIDKVHRLKSINEPKIILVGNSNMAWGIHSEKVEEAMGMPVVNLGLHGGLGNAFHEQIAKLNINKGDIVVIGHTSFSDNDAIGDPALAWITYDYHDELKLIIRPKDYITMLSAYPNYLKHSYILWICGNGNMDEGGCYSRSAFNKYGDVVYKPDDYQMDVNDYFLTQPVTIPEINDICINRLNDLNKYCREKGASMVVVGYPIAYGEYAEFTEKDFEEFQMELESVLDCDVISDYTHYFFPYSYFYNTELHLTDRGAEVRTSQLISDLKNWIENYQ